MDCIARLASLSMGFPRQEFWSGLLFLSPGDLLEPGNKPTSPELACGSLLLSYREAQFLGYCFEKVTTLIF